MKTGNWIVFILAAVFASSLLWLPGLLGMQTTIPALDILIPAVWAVIIVIPVAAIMHASRSDQQQSHPRQQQE